MPEILTPSEYQRAKPGLKYAANKLNEAANSSASLYQTADADREVNGWVDNPTFDPLINPVTDETTQIYYRTRKESWIEETKKFIRQNFPRATPSFDAETMIPEWFEKAIDCGYPVHDANVRKCLARFVMAMRTDGFSDEDTTGTQMGNFQGDWRGGGFLQ